MSSVIICVGTIGSPTFDRCTKAVSTLSKLSSCVSDVRIIKDQFPQCAWLNQMRKESSSAEWCLQVDEDMYLKPHALDRLLGEAERLELEGHRILNVSSLLYDLFLEEKIGSLKLWSTNALSQLEFRDTLGGDRDFAVRAKALGFSNFSISDVLGYHDSAPTAAIAFSKYYEYTQKLIKFKSKESAEKFSRSLKRKWDRDGSYISKKAYDGSKHGLLAGIKDVSKRGLKKV